MNAEAIMIASEQNIKRLVAFASRGPRRVAQVAALRGAEAGRRGFHGVREHHGRCPLPPSGTFFNRLGNSANFAVTDFSEVGQQRRAGKLMVAGS